MTPFANAADCAGTLPPNPSNGRFLTPARIQDNVGHAAYGRLHATAGERYTNDVEDRLLGCFNCSFGQVFEASVCNVVGEDMANVESAGHDDLRMSVFRTGYARSCDALGRIGPQIDLSISLIGDSRMNKR